MVTPALEATGLTKRYGARTGLDGLSFAAGTGEVLGLLGPNGAGKTTAIRLLTTILPPTSGHFRVAGETEPARIRQRIGVLPESAGYPGRQTGAEYLRYHARLFGLSRGDAAAVSDRLLAEVGLTDRAASRIATYSRGMRQRLGIARALVNDPGVVFLDEPTLGLDPAGQRQVLAMISTIAAGRGATVVLSTHALPEVEQICDRVLILGRGPVLMFGYAVLLSAISYLAATNRGLNFLEQREAVNLVLQVAMAVGVLVTLLVSADTISGERERGTLESLLLTPVGRRSVAVGKLLGALSLWLGCVVVSVPYLWVIGRSVAAVRPAVLTVVLAGTLVAVALAGLGLVVSGLSSSNRVSLAVSLLVLLALFAPTQLPGMAKSWVGDLLIRVNPLGSTMEFASRVILGRNAWRHELDYLIAPAVLVVLVVAVMVVAGNRLVRLGGVSGE